MNNALARSPSKLESFAVRSYSAVTLLGTTALGGVGGYSVGEALTGEGHPIPVIGAGLDTLVGVGAGVVGACIGTLIGVRTLIVAHRLEKLER